MAITVAGMSEQGEQPMHTTTTTDDDALENKELYAPGDLSWKTQLREKYGHIDDDTEQAVS